MLVRVTRRIRSVANGYVTPALTANGYNDRPVTLHRARLVLEKPLWTFLFPKRIQPQACPVTTCAAFGLAEVRALAATAPEARSIQALRQRPVRHPLLTVLPMH
jgi:hypothetical protein